MTCSVTHYDVTKTLSMYIVEYSLVQKVLKKSTKKCQSYNQKYKWVFFLNTVYT